MECSNCLINESKDKMKKIGSNWYCEDCARLIESPIDYEKIKIEFEEYVNELKEKNKNKKYDCLFALSGGKDSIAALYYTIEKYGLRPLAFTVDHGFKNKVIMENCKNIVQHYNIDWFILKVDKSITLQLWDLANEGDLPCCYCNRLWKGPYFAKAIEITGISDLFIGGDTLDKNTAIISRPDYNTDTVGLPLPLNIKTEQDIYNIAYSLGWENPNTKGWDTDCIAVGIALKNYREKFQSVHIEEVKHLAHRVRYGILNKEEALKMLNEPMIIQDQIMEQFENVVKSEASND